MNKLPIEKQVQIVKGLTEGMSLHSLTRMTGCSINTVSKLMVEIGRACQVFHYETVKNLKTKRVQCDEIWSFVGSKEKNVSSPEVNDGLGDVWTWVGMDSDSKLCISWLVGERNADCAYYFKEDIARRLCNRVQMTTDGLKVYLQAVEFVFGSDIDFSQLVKIYGGNGGESGNERKYSPDRFRGSKKSPVSGNPDPKHISTSHIERQNLTMRMSIRRFTRLTNGFSKKIENHCHAIALYFVHYNFCLVHKTLRVTPAMEAGLADDVMSYEWLLSLIDRYKSTN